MFTSDIHKDLKVEDKVNNVYKLKKDLYGLKQAPRAWYGRIDNFLTTLGFTKGEVDPINVCR